MCPKGRVFVTLADLVTSVTNSVNGFVPDLSIFIAGGAVIGLSAWAAKRLVKAGR